MRPLFFALVIFSFYACGSGSAVSKQLSGADSLVINFNKPQTNIIDRTVSTTEDKAIKKLARFVDGKMDTAYKCGYDGNLMFYKKGQLAGDVAFNFSGKGCLHFIMELNGKLTPTEMSNEAADFLKSLSEGKNWY